MKNQAELFWDKHAKVFDDNQKPFETASLEILSRTKEYLDAKDHVLDFGCATGSKTIELSGGVKNIRGLDFSAEMIGEAIKKKNQANAANVTFSQGTIYTDDLEKASFDKILAFSIIHLLDDSEKAIQRIHELLKPGGLLIAETACFKNRMNFRTRAGFAFTRFMIRLGIFPLHLNMYTSADVEKLISRHDFKIIKAEAFFFNGMTISYIVAEKP